MLYNTFSIRCPASLLTSTDMFQLFDFELGVWDLTPFNDTAFCGKSSSKNSITLFWDIVASLDYKYVIFFIR